MRTIKRLLSLTLVLLMLCGTMAYNAPEKADAIYSFAIQRQNISKWNGVYYGAGDLYDTGCGIFALVNAVGCLTGKSMDVKTVAQYAYDIGAYNNGGANGTARLVLYPKVEAKFGATYGFTLDCNGDQGWWAGSSSSVLKNHLLNGGVAVGHVPGHFIAVVEYNSSNGKFHVYDSYPTTARGTGTGDCWVTASQLATNKLKLDWFCLLSKADDGTIKENPTITVGSTQLTHGMTLTPSWTALDNATSYTYSVKRYDSEMSNSTVPAVTVASGTTTSTSFTVPAQSTGKYLQITVTANGAKNSTSATKTVLIGANVSQPSGMEYIPVTTINGGTGTSATTVWNIKKGASFTAAWWHAVLCTPQSDGSYKASTLYTAAGTVKDIPITGGNIIIASHSGMSDYSKVTRIKAGDKITLHGLYLDDGTIRGSGYILVNDGIVSTPVLSVPKTTLNYGETMDITWGACTGATTYGAVVKNGSTTIIYNENVTGNKISIPAQNSGTSLTVTITAWNSVRASSPATVTITLINPAPTDITVSSDKTIVKDANDSTCYKGFTVGTTASVALNKFAEDKSFLQIRDMQNATLAADAPIGTGFTVNIVDGSDVTKSYTLVVTGDCNGDGSITASDYAAQRSHLNGGSTMDGAFFIAGDCNGDNNLSATDCLVTLALLQGN